MPYDASFAGLTKPGTGPVLDPAPFKGNEDAVCADLARLVYFDFDNRRADLEEALGRHGLRLAKTFHKRWLFVDSEVLIATAADGTAYVIFRGTQDVWDLLTDLAALPARWIGGGWVHWGFRKGWNLLAGEIASWLADNRPRRIVTSGHSLGAALATLFAASAPAAELVTFGCPLVGSAKFVALFAGRSVRRYRHCCDLVSRIPPDWLIYRQLGGLRYVDRTGTLHQDLDRAAIKADMAEGARAFHRARLGGVPVRNLADHAPLNYVWALTGELTPL